MTPKRPPCQTPSRRPGPGGHIADTSPVELIVLSVKEPQPIAGCSPSTTLSPGESDGRKSCWRRLAPSQGTSVVDETDDRDPSVLEGHDGGNDGDPMTGRRERDERLRGSALEDDVEIGVPGLACVLEELPCPKPWREHQQPSSAPTRKASPPACWRGTIRQPVCQRLPAR